MFIFFQIIIFLGVCDEIFSLPYDVEKCRIDDASCLVRSSNKVLSKYYAGITEIDLQSIDPYGVSIAPFSYDFIVAKSDGICYNVKAVGNSAATVQSFSGFDKNLVEIQFKMPKISMSGLYRANITVFGFQMKNEGSMTINLYDYSMKLIIKLERFARNGKEYFRTTGLQITADLRTGDVQSPEITPSIIWAINSSFDIFFKSSAKTIIQDTFGKYYNETLNAVFNKTAIEDLFLI